MLTPRQGPACHTQLLLSTCLSHGGDGPRITLQRPEPQVAPKPGPCPSGKAVQLLARGAEAQAHPTATMVSFTRKSQRRGPRGWLAGQMDSLSVPKELPRRSLQGDSALAVYVSRSRSPCSRMEQGFLEMTADGNKPGGGSAGGSEGRWAGPGGWIRLALGSSPPLPAPSLCKGRSPLSLKLSPFDSLGSGEGLALGQGPEWARPSLPDHQVELGGCALYGE